MDDSGYLHGWLDKNSDGWQAMLAFYDILEEPWYSLSYGEEPEYVGDIRVDPCYSSYCGEEPEYVGEIHIRLLSETTIETQIKFSDDDEWQPPVVLTLQHHDASS